jgi:alkylation response protein AidB-like acyl-CoA dehydrogenase
MRPMQRNESAVVGQATHLSVGPPAAGLVERVRALVPMIAENAERAEEERKPVDAVIAALAATGVFKSFVPKRFGGYEIDSDTFIDVGAAVSEACTSTGWVTTFYMEHNWMLAQFPAQTLEEVFGKQPYVLAPASISPTGRAQAVDGGYRVTGRWAWATGVMHADWVLLNGVVQSEQPDVRLFLLPRAEVRVLDTWNAAGMQGTGSNDVVCEDVFVPAERSESLLAMSNGRGRGAEWLGSPTYRHPMLPLLSIAAAVPALGAAQRAVALFQERLGGRMILGSQTRQAERAPSQIRLGHASARLHTAETVLRDVGRTMRAWGKREEPCPVELRARLRLSAAHAVDLCRTTVREVMEASGASAHLKSNPLQRIHRDVHTLACHTVFDPDVSAESYGRVLLGMAPNSLL